MAEGTRWKTMEENIRKNEIQLQQLMNSTQEFINETRQKQESQRLIDGIGADTNAKFGQLTQMIRLVMSKVSSTATNPVAISSERGILDSRPTEMTKELGSFGNSQVDSLIGNDDRNSVSTIDSRRRNQESDRVFNKKLNQIRALMGLPSVDHEAKYQDPNPSTDAYCSEIYESRSEIVGLPRMNVLSEQVEANFGQIENELQDYQQEADRDPTILQIRCEFSNNDLKRPSIPDLDDFLKEPLKVISDPVEIIAFDVASKERNESLDVSTYWIEIGLATISMNFLAIPYAQQVFGVMTTRGFNVSAYIIELENACLLLGSPNWIFLPLWY